MERLIDIPAGTTTVDLGATKYVGLTYQKPVTLDTAKATLTRRTSAHAPGKPVPARDWAFADCTTTPFPGTPDGNKLCVKGGFDPASEYTLVYTAQDPAGSGDRLRGHARSEFVSALRHEPGQSAGRTDPVGHQPRRFAIRQLHPQLHSPRLQPGRGRPHRLGWRQPAHRRAATGAQFPLCRGRRLRGALPARQRGRAVVERLRRPRAPPRGGRPAGPLPRHQHVSQDFRHLRRRGVLVPARIARPGGHGRQGRHSAAAQRAPLFLPRNHARRRPRRLQHHRTRRAGELHASGQSQSRKRHHARADGGVDRLGEQGDGAAAKPVSAPRSACRSQSRRHRFPQDSRRAFAGRPGEPGLRFSISDRTSITTTNRA